MDAHRDPAVDIMAPQQLGRIQRRPFDIALNIDRHEPQLRGGLDRDRRERLGEFRREVRQQELPRWELCQQKRVEFADFPIIKQTLLLVVLGILTGTMLLELLVYAIPLIVYGKDYESFKAIVHSTTTDTDLKTSLILVNRLVKFGVLGYEFGIVARLVCLVYILWQFDTKPVKESTLVAIYHYLSLVSYATTLFLTLANGFVSHGLTNVIKLMSGCPSEYVQFIRNLCLSSQLHLVMDTLAEWLCGCILFQLEYTLRPQVTPWMAIISGMATMLVHVFVLVIY